MRTDAKISASLFVLMEKKPEKQVRILFDGEVYTVPAGISVASALLVSGIRTFRSTPVAQSPRAPYCMMGVCFECLVEIDGQPSRQSCLTQVSDGMVINRQHGASAINASGVEE